MTKKAVRIHNQLTGRIPDVNDTKGRARHIKRLGYMAGYARHIQRSSNRANRRLARMELAASALA